jgi:hypothetical protein
LHNFLPIDEATLLQEDFEEQHERTGTGKEPVNERKSGTEKEPGTAEEPESAKESAT